MSPHIAAEVSTMIDWGTLDTINDNMPPRDPDEEDEDEEDEEEIAMNQRS